MSIYRILLVSLVIVTLFGSRDASDEPSSKSSASLISSGSFAARSCSAADYKYGQWIPGADKCGLKSQYKRALEEHCATPGTDPNTWHWANWCWKPMGCIREPFSVSSFCRKLNGRSILMVGDSIQHQFYDAIFMQLETEGQPDGHRQSQCTGFDDNLHYFLPSVVDSWVQQLFNLIPEKF